MYIKSARITNIRSIEDFEINFEDPAGWHVLIGDNGSGKSTIIRSLALALVGQEEAPGLRADWRDWLSKNERHGKIILNIDSVESSPDVSESRNSGIDVYFEIEKLDSIEAPAVVRISSNSIGDLPLYNKLFSVAYGPYRRFSGGNPEWTLVYKNQPTLGAHLSAFSEDVALTEPIEWLIQLNHQELEQRLNAAEFWSPRGLEQENYPAEDSFSVLNCLKNLINTPNFLPNRTRFESVSSKGVFFQNENGGLVTVNQLSDGYRSILSLTFEMIRQLIDFYGEEAVFKNIRENKPDNMNIDLPGVVLIDEIDAHLHPTWQTKIGQWFLKYFPNLQFIVTTHSPLVCRAAEKGTIWKLAAPGSKEKSQEVTGMDRERLIYGNVLDAYGTEEFGKVDNTQAADKKEELVQLSKKQIAGKISPQEANKLHELRAIFSTDATVEL